MKTNNETIIDLLLNGNINKQTALILLNENNEHDDIEVSPKKTFKSKYELIDDAYNDIEPEFAFRVDDIIEYMNKIDWDWRGEKVTKTRFMSELKRLIKECVDKIVNEDKEEYSISTGGLEITAYIPNDDDKNYIEVEFKFIMDDGFLGLSRTDWINSSTYNTSNND